MNEIYINNLSLPVVCACDNLACDRRFLHANRLVPFHVMIYVTQGTIYVTEGNIDYEIQPGELFFLKSGLRHYGKVYIPSGTCWHYVHFILPQDAKKYEIFEPDYEGIRQNEKQEYSRIIPKHMTGLQNSELETEIFELNRYFHSTNPMKKWEINQLLWKLLFNISFEGMLYTSTQSVSDKIALFLSAHIADGFSAKTIEEEFYLSYKRLAAIFKEEKGMSMQRYHTQLRMNKACRLLNSTFLPIGEIAEQVGYVDPLFFSKQFHKVLGISPREYRKQPKRY